MIRSLASALLLLVVAASASGDELRLREQLASGKARAVFSSDGRLLEARGLDLPYGGEPVAASQRFIADASVALFGSSMPPPELKPQKMQESLTGTGVLFLQEIAGVEVIDAAVVVRLGTGGAVTGVSNRAVTSRGHLDEWRLDAAEARAAISRSPDELIRARRVLFPVVGQLRPTWELIVRRTALESFAIYVDAGDGSLLSERPLFFNAAARVFSANPVTVTNDGALEDRDDAAAAVPAGSYADVMLDNLASSGRLRGPHVEVTDIEAPSTVPAEAGGALSFNRDDDRFEDVMVYYHLDRSQRYLQSLGYAGSRQVIASPIRVDAHGAGGSDNSYYTAALSGGQLTFGDGGVDDAEDPDIVLHEYGHAIQDAIAPNAFFGSYASQARALGEGFGDYWAFSSSYDANRASGRDPYCIGDWDARCGDAVSTNCGYAAGADCLRRVDSGKTMSDFLFSEVRGIEHQNGEIWASALREVFLTAVAARGAEGGRRMIDTVVIESHFGIPPQPSFSTLARRMLEVDAQLYGGANQMSICAAMTARGILGASECATTTLGQFSLFQGGQREIEIPDDDPVGITLTRTVSDARVVQRVLVSVDIVHTFAGDLELTLIGPDGTAVLLQRAGQPIGPDLRTTFGADTQTAESLERFAGRTAAGTWTLRIIDRASSDRGRLVSWNLLLQLEGDEPMSLREASSAERQHLVAVASTAGAEGTYFVTDLRMFNGGSREAEVTAIFTPAGRNGSADFSAVQIVIAAGQTIAFDDVVATLFRRSGAAGNIEFRGDVADVIIRSRVYNRTAQGTYAQAYESVPSSRSIAAGTGVLHLVHLQNSAAFRTNIGFSDVAGSTGEIEVRLFNGEGVELDRIVRAVEPFSLLQVGPILGGKSGRIEDRLRAEVRVLSGDARVVTYASVIDNGTGDSVHVAGTVTPAAGERFFPAAVRADGAAGTKWRSDISLTNVSDDDVTATLRFIPAAGEERSSTSSIGSRGSVVLADAVLTAFGLESAAGQMRVTSPAIVAMRTWNDGSGGSFGQFVPAYGASDTVRGSSGIRHLIQLDANAAFRTNIGLAEVLGSAAVVLIRAFDSAGNEIFSAIRDVAPNGWLQFNLNAEGAPALSNGRATLEVVGGEGGILGWASVIDNRTGDPINIVPR